MSAISSNPLYLTPAQSHELADIANRMVAKGDYNRTFES